MSSRIQQAREKVFKTAAAARAHDEVIRAMHEFARHDREALGRDVIEYFVKKHAEFLEEE